MAIIKRVESVDGAIVVYGENAELFRVYGELQSYGYTNVTIINSQGDVVEFDPYGKIVSVDKKRAVSKRSRK